MKFELALISMQLIYSVYLLVLTFLSVQSGESSLNSPIITLGVILLPLTLTLLVLGLVILGFQKKVASFLIGIAGFVSLPLGILSLTSAYTIYKSKKSNTGMTLSQAAITLTTTILMILYYTYR